MATKLDNSFYYGVPFCFLFRKPIGNPETLGWCLLIQELTGGSVYRKSPSIGIVVDSELGRLKEINARQAPIRSELSLPSNVTLIYGADAAADTAVNHLIRIADRTCTMMMREIRNLGFPRTPREVVGPPFRGQIKITTPNSPVL